MTTSPSPFAAVTAAAILSKYAVPSRFQTAGLTGRRTALVFHRCWITRNVCDVMAVCAASSTAVGDAASSPG